ncbi:hypothetical protein DFH27DRAFT_608599 [Peziza echinospora]|nr:hypothetical protein DFH27DRAFT_608599 [Peziza echinospora]
MSARNREGDAGGGAQRSSNETASTKPNALQPYRSTLPKLHILSFLRASPPATMSESYTPLEFIAEPEPLPPTPLRSQSPVDEHRKGGRSHDQEPSEGWTSLSIPGALLNGTIYIVGKTIEKLGPYWPNEERRELAWLWAQDHPILASFLCAQLIFVAVPVLWFLTFAFWLALIVGVGAVAVVGAGVGLGCAFTWSWAYGCYRVWDFAWKAYTNYQAGDKAAKAKARKALVPEDTNEEQQESLLPHHGHIKTEPVSPPEYVSDAKVTQSTNGYSSETEDSSPDTRPLSSTSSGVDVKVVGEFSEDGIYQKKISSRDEDKVMRDIVRSLS